MIPEAEVHQAFCIWCLKAGEKIQLSLCLSEAPTLLSPSLTIFEFYRTKEMFKVNWNKLACQPTHFQNTLPPTTLWTCSKATQQRELCYFLIWKNKIIQKPFTYTTNITKNLLFARYSTKGQTYKSDWNMNGILKWFSKNAQVFFFPLNANWSISRDCLEQEFTTLDWYQFIAC